MPASDLFSTNGDGAVAASAAPTEEAVRVGLSAASGETAAVASRRRGGVATLELAPAVSAGAVGADARRG